jgi:MFS family permease
MVVPLIPVYGKRLGASHLELGLLVAGFFAGRLLAQIPAGIATDRFGRRPVLLLALLGYGATCVGYALSTSVGLLIAFRLLQGLSSAFFTVAARSLVSDLCRRHERGAAQGVLSSSVNLGFVAGPVVGALTAEHFHITTPFWAAAALIAVAFPVLAPMVPRAPRERAVKPRSPRGVLAALRDRRVISLAAANLCFLAGMSVVMTLFPVAGETRIPGGLRFVGLALTTAGMCGMIAGPFAGRLSDRLGRTPMMAVGVLLSAAEGTALYLTDSPWIVAACFGAGGLGAATFSNGLHAAVGDLTVSSGRGRVTGVVGLAGEIGGITGSLLAPAIWQRTDLHAPFALHPAFAILAVIFALWLVRLGAPRSSEPAVVRETIIPG